MKRRRRGLRVLWRPYPNAGDSDRLEWARLHADPIGRPAVDAQHRARRARIVRGHATLADVGLEMVVAERDIVPACVAHFVGEDR